MPRVILGCLGMVLLLGVLGADYPQVAPEVGRGRVYVWYQETNLPNDTLWHPGYGIDDATPSIWGINLTDFRFLGAEIAILQEDTVLLDTIRASWHTGFYGHKDSVASAYAFVVIADTTNCPDAKKWIPLVDSSSAYWFERYAWLRLIFSTTNTTDTTDYNVSEKTLWAAAGDSLRDWNFFNGTHYSPSKDSLYLGIDELPGATNWNDWIYVKGKDSLVAFAMQASQVATSPGIIDSVVLTLVVSESLDVVASDTLRVGIAFGDSSLHHYDSLSAVSWGTNQVILDNNANDTLGWTFTLTPRSLAWTRTTLDSMIVIFDPVHVDTTTAGAKGILQIVQMWVAAYHDRSYLVPTVKYRVTCFLKE